MAEEIGTFKEGRGFSFNNLLNKTGAIFEAWAEQSIAKQFAQNNANNPTAPNVTPTAGTDWKKIGIIAGVGLLAFFLLKKLF